MLPTMLIRRIESKWEQIVGSVIDDTQRDRRLASYQALSTQELRKRAEDLVRNLGHWLTNQDEAEIARRFEDLGQRRYREGFALAEVVRKIQLLEEKLVQAARDENDAKNSLDIYGELEILRALNQFFWLANYHVVVGYEAADGGDIAPAQPIPERSASSCRPVPHVDAADPPRPSRLGASALDSGID